MEWVEVTGKTVEVAQAAALDHLGVHESEAEFDIVSEGRAGVFGLFAQDARVRARVLPKQPRPKQERRPRKGKGGGGAGGGRGSGGGRGGRNSGGKGSGSGRNGRGPNAERGDDGGKRSNADRSKSEGPKGQRKNQSGGAKQKQAAKDGGSGAAQDRQAAGKDKGRSSAKAADSPATDGPKPKTRDTEATDSPPAAGERGPRQRNRKDRDRGRESATTEPTAGSAAGETGSVPAPSGPAGRSSAQASDIDRSTTTSERTTARPGVVAAGAGAVAAGAGVAAANQIETSEDRRPSTAPEDPKQEETMSTDEITVEQQGEIASDFLDGLLESFGADGEIKSTMVDDDVIEVAVHGNDLGLMIGPKGATLHAIQELARTAVQRSGQGTHRGRLLLDVGGYRQHRRAALEKFAGQVAERVIAENKEHALEPMNSADRKAIHDAVNEIDGVRTISEGEDPRRRIVIMPAD